VLERYHKVLIGVLCAQLALFLLVITRSGDTGRRAEHLLLPGFDAAKVTRIQVEGSGNAIDVVKKGDKWVLANAFDYPVDDVKVGDLLTPLAKLAATDPIATSASRHKQLRVANDDFDRKVTLTADGKSATIVLGNPVGSRHYAMRFGNDDDVYEVSLAPRLAGVEPREWIQTTYVKLPVAETTKITVTRADGTFEIAREDSSKPWAVTVDGAPFAGELDGLAVDRLGLGATLIDAIAPADPKRDASKPTATITIETKSGGTSPAPVVIDVIADATGYWVHQRGNDRAVLADKARLDDAVAVSKDKLTKKAAPPKPPPGLPPGLELPPGMPPLTP
jgi:hypothetical protein